MTTTGDHTDAELSAMVVALEHVESAIASLQAMRASVLTQALHLAERRAEGQTARVKAQDMELRGISAEIGAAVRTSDRAIQAQISRVWELTERFPLAHQALSDGVISLAHAHVIVEAGCNIHDDDARTEFCRRAVEIARHETPARLRGFVATLAETALPQSITERHQIARAARSVSLRDLPDGMCELLAILPAVLGKGIHDRLTRMGVALKDVAKADAEAARARSSLSATNAVGANSAGGMTCTDDAVGTFDPADASRIPSDGAPSGDAPTAFAPSCAQTLVADDAPIDSRTLDQYRADLLCDMLLTATPETCADGIGAITAHVEVTVPAFTLAGLSDSGAQLAGGAPIDADTARILAGGAKGWDRVLTHPVSNAVLAVDRYRPTADIRRALRARDQRCRYAGCMRSPLASDMDHIIDAALGGETDVENLCLECRRHHSMKHHTGWTLRHLGGGVIEWTSPLGRVYIDVPPRTVAFTPTSVDDWLACAPAATATSGIPF